MLGKLGAVLAGSRVNLLTLSSTLHLGHPWWTYPGFEKTFCFNSPNMENTLLVFLHQPGRTLKDRRSQFSVWSTVVGKLESVLRQSLLIWSAPKSEGCSSTFERQVVQTARQAVHSWTGKRNGGVGQTRQSRLELGSCTHTGPSSSSRRAGVWGGEHGLPSSGCTLPPLCLEQWASISPVPCNRMVYPGNWSRHGWLNVTEKQALACSWSWAGFFSVSDSIAKTGQETMTGYGYVSLTWKKSKCWQVLREEATSELS